MTEDSITSALTRIDRALARIEVIASRKPVSVVSDPRYEALRSRTQAALASLETVISNVGERH